MHRDTILKAAKVLVDNAKKLVAGAGSSQEELASAAKESVNTITRLTEFMKRGAASLGSNQPEAQVRHVVETIILDTAVFILQYLIQLKSDYLSAAIIDCVGHIQKRSFV